MMFYTAAINSAFAFLVAAASLDAENETLM